MAPLESILETFGGARGGVTVNKNASILTKIEICGKGQKQPHNASEPPQNPGKTCYWVEIWGKTVFFGQIIPVLKGGDAKLYLATDEYL